MFKKKNELSDADFFKKIFSKKKYCEKFLKDIFQEDIKEFQYLNLNKRQEDKQILQELYNLVLETEKEIIILELYQNDTFNSQLSLYLSKLCFEYWEQIYKRYRKKLKVCLVMDVLELEAQNMKLYQELEVKLHQDSHIIVKIWNLKEAIKEKNKVDYKYALLFEQNNRNKYDINLPNHKIEEN